VIHGLHFNNLRGVVLGLTAALASLFFVKRMSNLHFDVSLAAAPTGD
jgi:hypothetical protein